MPGAVKEPKVTLKGNNAITVECSPLKENEWRGEKRRYHAIIENSKTHYKLEKTDKVCFFEFDDLSYSMDYVVLVGVTNPSCPTYPGTCRTLINGISCVFRSLPSMEFIKGLRQMSKLRPAVCILHSSFLVHTPEVISGKTQLSFERYRASEPAVSVGIRTLCDLKNVFWAESFRKQGFLMVVLSPWLRPTSTS